MVNHLSSLPRRIERKFFVAPTDRGSLWPAAANCRLDGQFPSEQINSLYFDTSGLDEYQSGFENSQK
jgi:hypothetical protein